MDAKHESVEPSGWREGWILAPTARAASEDKSTKGSFRTLERPGAVAPSATPAPWSFDPGLPAGSRVETSALAEDTFVLGLLGPDGRPGSLRGRVTGAGHLAGETTLDAAPSLFSPGQTVQRRESAWILEIDDLCVALVVRPQDAGLRFGLAWGPGTADALRSSAAELLTVELPPPPEVKGPDAGEADSAAEPAGQPSASAECVHRHGGKLIAAAFALGVALVVWGIAAPPWKGDPDQGQVARMVRQLNAMGRHDDALALCDSEGDRLTDGMEDRLRATVYYSLGDYAKAAERYRAAAEVAAGLDDDILADALRMNLASSLFRAGQAAEAEAIYQELVDTREGGNSNLLNKAKAALEILKEIEGTLPPKNVGH